MRLGTKSLLFGVHQFLLHPLLLAYAWTKLYGFPTNYRLWFAFFLHDIGYWGKPNMDGPEGKTHPELGAKVMGWLFGKAWGTFTICHSRHYAKMRGFVPSRLCVADKMVPFYTPMWLYMIQGHITGEIHEYMTHAAGKLEFSNARGWFQALRIYMSTWCDKNKDTALCEPK